MSAKAPLAHHFEDLEQQTASMTLGMWLFLATEIMFFGGLFTGYVVYRTAYPDAFDEASRTLSLTLGGVNTVALLASSLTMALAVRAAQTGKRTQLIGFLLLTMLLGTMFLAIKAVEYGDKIHHHHVPGRAFVWEGDNPAHAQLFFVLYFAMTGLHAIHMVIGVVLLAILVVLSLMGRFTPERFLGVELSGLYWHFVDIVWVFLFPLLYLIDRS